MLFSVETVHLNIVTRTYYFYLDTINDTNNLRDLTITKFNESSYNLCCFPLSFQKYYETRSQLCNTIAKFVCNFGSRLFCKRKFFCNITIAASYFQPPPGNSHPFLYWNCFSESCIFSANICWSWRRLEHVFSAKSFRLPRRLEDVLKASRKTS